MKKELMKLSRTIQKNSPAILKTVMNGCKKHSPEIFTGLSIAGVITTCVLAGKNTIKAVEIVKEAEAESEEPLTMKDKVFLTWKVYIPTVSSAVFTGICIGGINASHKKRTAAIAAAYKTLEGVILEYDDAVHELVDKETYDKIKGTMQEKQMRDTPVPDDVVIKNGDHLCFDPYSGRYFSSNTNKLEQAINYVNKCMLDDGIFIEMNVWYDEIGLDPTALSNKVGWSYDPNYTTDLVELRLSTRLTADGQPCIIVDFDRVDWC